MLWSDDDHCDNLRLSSSISLGFVGDCDALAKGRRSGSKDGEDDEVTG